MHRILAALSTLLWLAASSTELRAADPAAPPESSPSTFLVRYSQGPAWLPGKPLAEQPLREHGSYLLDLYIQGTMKYAGPFLDDSGGAAVIEAENEAAARTLVAADPAIVSGLMIAEVLPWRLVDWQVHADRRAERETADGSSVQGRSH